MKLLYFAVHLNIEPIMVTCEPMGVFLFIVDTLHGYTFHIAPAYRFVLEDILFVK